jgi:hypothetical protein
MTLREHTERHSGAQAVLNTNAHRRTQIGSYLRIAGRRRQAVIAGLLALTLTALTAAGIAVHNAATAACNAATSMPSPCPASSRPRASTSTAPIR